MFYGTCSFFSILKDVSVDNDFVILLRKIQQRRTLNVTYGIMLRHDELRKGDNPVVLDTDDPATILFELVKTRNLRLIDLLKNLDRDNSDTLSRDELRKGMEVLYTSTYYKKCSVRVTNVRRYELELLLKL